MKRILFILTAILLAGSVFAQKAPSTKLISSTENKVVINVQLNGFSYNKVQTPQGEQFIVNVPEMAAMLEAGTPNLPTLPIPVIIDDRAEMSVSVIDAQYTDIPNIDIAPSKGNISRQINPDDVPYTYGEMYQQNAFWPAAQAYLETPYILRDFRGQNVMVRPFAYNPQTHTLRVYDNLTIEMVKVSDNGVNQKVGRRTNTIRVDAETQHAYSRRFINFNQTGAKYDFVSDQGEMLVICADQFMEGMEEFVAWKNESGRPTTMVSVSEVGGNNDTNIKNYITSLYNDPEHNLQFVLFVGDYEHITPHSVSGERSDNWFGQIEGNDHYPEVFVGRFSVQTNEQVATHVNKVLYYERDVTENDTWTNKGLGIGAIGAGSGHYGEDDYQHIDFIRDTLEHYTYEQVTDLHEGGGASASSISATINAGVSIINYCNHGSETSWGVANYSNSNVNALTNDNMLPIVWSVACLNGQFNYGSQCFAEAWMRATDNSNGTPTGAIGGMFSWMSQPWIPPMYGQDEMVDILTEWCGGDLFNHTLSGASANGNMKVIDMSGSGGYATHDTWILFGDPSLMVRTDIATPMTVSTNPSVLMLGMTELAVTADASFGIVTLAMNGEVIATANLVDGTANLVFPELNNVGNATLTIMGYNKVTYRGEVEIVPAEGPYLVLNDYIVATEDGNINYGEEATVNLGIKNVGVESIGNVTLTISTDSEYVTEFINNTAVIENINPDELIYVEDEFRFVVANNIPDETKITFKLEMTAGEETWENAFTLTAQAPNLVLTEVTATDGLTPGGSGVMTFTFNNIGHATAHAEMLNVFSSSQDISFTSNAIEVSPIIAGESITIEVPFTIAEAVLDGSCYEISYLLNAEHYSLNGTTFISVGNISEGFETGDFTHFDWTFDNTQPWTIENANAYAGDYCARSGVIGHQQSTRMIVSVYVPVAGEISFYRKVSSENNYDKLYFKMDGSELANWSGEQAWALVTFPISAGQHTLVWEYTKDYSMTGGQDCAWIDEISLPATSIQHSAEPLTDLVATVNDNQVTLEWTPVDRVVSYTIFRNGMEVSTQEGANFVESVEQGVYTYSVVMLDEEGVYSQPTFVTVNVTTTLSVNESSAKFLIYPNPTEGNLYIQVAGSYSYTLFNGFGQQVMNGKANGYHQLNLGGLAKGIYLLQLNNGEQSNIQKVIVK